MTVAGKSLPDGGGLIPENYSMSWFIRQRLPRYPLTALPCQPGRKRGEAESLVTGQDINGAPAGSDHYIGE